MGGRVGSERGGEGDESIVLLLLLLCACVCVRACIRGFKNLLNPQ